MTGPVREDWRPPFCPDPTGCRPLIHPLTDGDNMTLDKRGYAVYCWGRLAAPLAWTFDDVEHVETLSTCQSSPLKGVVRWLENEADWSALLRSYRAAISAAHAMCAVPLCGHPEADHYEYSLNGQPQTRCHSCDPHANRGEMPTLYAMTAGSFEAAMFAAADHDFLAPE